MRKVLVTAGASGIGNEGAAASMAAGDSVYTCDINHDGLEEAARDLPGPRVVRIAGDQFFLSTTSRASSWENRQLPFGVAACERLDHGTEVTTQSNAP